MAGHAFVPPFETSGLHQQTEANSFALVALSFSTYNFALIFDVRAARRGAGASEAICP
jgi:hypothetical protein